MIVLIKKTYHLCFTLSLLILLLFSCKKDKSPTSWCADPSACNYDDTVEIAEPNDCEYAELNHNCDEECIVDIDCLEICAGLNEEDNCTTCDANPWNDCTQNSSNNWVADAVLYPCEIEYSSGNNVIITVCVNYIGDISGFQFTLKSNNFEINSVNVYDAIASSNIDNNCNGNCNVDTFVLSFGMGADLKYTTNNGTKLAEFHVEYSEASGIVSVISAKGSISLIDPDGEEITVSTVSKNWSNIPVN